MGLQGIPGGLVGLLPCFAAALPLAQGMVGQAALPLTLGYYSGFKEY